MTSIHPGSHSIDWINLNQSKKHPRTDSIPKTLEEPQTGADHWFKRSKTVCQDEILFMVHKLSTTKLKILKIFQKTKFLCKKSKNLGKIVTKISQTVGISCAREANEQFFVSSKQSICLPGCCNHRGRFCQRWDDGTVAFVQAPKWGNIMLETKFDSIPSFHLFPQTRNLRVGDDSSRKLWFRIQFLWSNGMKHTASLSSRILSCDEWFSMTGTVPISCTSDLVQETNFLVHKFVNERLDDDRGNEFDILSTTKKQKIQRRSFQAMTFSVKKKILFGMVGKFLRPIYLW